MLGPPRTQLTLFLAEPSPRLPRHGAQAFAALGTVSLTLHVVVLTCLAILVGGRTLTTSSDSVAPRLPQERPRLVVLMEPVAPESGGGGGGGGGNESPAPPVQAQAPGIDLITLPVTPPVVAADEPADLPAPLQAVALDARPLASALALQVGTVEGGTVSGDSQGPGRGGGVGSGDGSGIGSGTGPGVGPGFGGGTGGGVYRPGNGVTPPRVLSQVRPSYTPEALSLGVQGAVTLEAVIGRDGTPAHVRVIRSLDPGLDHEAIMAVQQWRFAPGRFRGEPVDVLVSFVLDFHIH